MECVAGPGSWLTLGDKLALVLIGDLVADGNPYWEAQESLAERMGVSRRSAGRAVRKLEEHGALYFLGWRRTQTGATVKTFAYEPEELTEVGQTVTPEMGATVPPQNLTDETQVGSSVHPGGDFHAPRWEETGLDVGSVVPQTEGTDTEQILNPDKLAAPPPIPATLEDPQALETERQRQYKALTEIAHVAG